MNRYKILRSGLGMMLIVSVMTIFGAYYDADFYFLDYAAGYFYGFVGAASLLLFIAVRHLGQPPQTEKVKRKL